MPNKIILLKITDLNKNIYLNDNLTINTAKNLEPDVTISGSMVNLLRRRDITISGDPVVAQKLQQKIDSFDWENLLAKYIGDIATHQVSRFLNSQKTTCKNIMETLVEYIQEEVKLLPPQCLVTDFIDEVDKIRADVDRLEAKISS